MPLVIGLTGNIACGKSAIGRFLMQRGIPVIDSDDIVHELYKQDEEMQKELLGIFKTLDRKLIAQQVFQDETLRKKLEQVIHPRVEREFQNWLKKHHDKSLVVNLVPLLFEAGLEARYDKIVCVLSPSSKQIQRLKLRRPDLSDEEIQARINSQMDQELKAKKSDFVIDNNGTLEDLEGKTDEFLLKHL